MAHVRQEVAFCPGTLERLLPRHNQVVGHFVADYGIGQKEAAGAKYAFLRDRESAFSVTVVKTYKAPELLLQKNRYHEY